MPKTEFAALVAAAGKSLRMGKPKHTLIINNKSFIENIIDAFAQSGVNNLFASIPDDGIDSFTKQIFRTYNVRHFTNNFPHRQLLGSVQSCLSQIELYKISGLFIIPVDMPFVTNTLVHDMMTQHRLANAPSIVCASFKGHLGHPILFGHGYFKAITQLKDDNSLRDLMNAHKEHIIQVESFNAKIVSNINTMHDYERLTNPSESMVDAAATEAPGTKFV